MLELTGLTDLWGRRKGTQQQVNRHVEEAIVAYRREESVPFGARDASQGITLTQDETFTGGLCLVGMDAREQLHLVRNKRPRRDQTPGMPSWSGRLWVSTVQ